MARTNAELTPSEIITISELNNVGDNQIIYKDGIGEVIGVGVGSGLTISGGNLIANGAGTGDVVGPSSAVDSNFASFDTTTGKLIKDSGKNANDFAPETAITIGALIGGTLDAIPNDTDYIATSLTAGGILQKLTWTNAKAFLKTYFDSIYKVVTSRNVGNSTDLDTFLGNIDDSITSQGESGFGAWTSGTDASTYTITGGKIQINRSGYGYINGKKINWIANQQTGVLSANTFYWIYMDGNGTIQTTTTFVSGVITLYEVLYDGTYYYVAKENHPKSFPSSVSSYAHNAIGNIIFSTGANIERVGSGTGASTNDRQVKIVGADTFSDHGLSTSIPDSAGAGVTWNIMYRNAGGKWVTYAQQVELPPYYNNAGTPTALDATPNIYSVYVLYIKKDDINSSEPQYFAVMNETAYTLLSDAKTAITDGTITFSSNELKNMEEAQLGYAIVQYSATGGYIEEVIIAKSTLNQQFVGGGGGAGADHSLLSNLTYETSGHLGFTSPSSIDTFTNKTFDTAGTGNSFKINGTSITDKTGTGKAVLDTAPQISQIELGHASDTTISRVSAGQIAVEGTNVLMNGGALGTPSSGTLTNCTGLPGANLTLSDVTTNNVSTSAHGFAPKLPNDATKYLDGTGNYTVPASGSSFWTLIPGTPTRTSNTTFTITGDYTTVLKKGMIIKWTESDVIRNAMISIPSTYSAPNTTITIIGDTMASIDASSCKYTFSEAIIKEFVVTGSIGATGTDVSRAYYAPYPMRVLGVDLQVGTAGTTNSTTVDINKNGTTMFTTKPTLATTVASSPTPFTANTATSLSLGDKVTIDIDAVQTTPAIDLYVQLYMIPTRINYLT